MVNRLKERFEQEKNIIDAARANGPTDELLTITLQPRAAMGGIWLDKETEFWQKQSDRIKKTARRIYGPVHYANGMTENVSLHKYITGDTILSYSHAFVGLVSKDEPKGLYTTAITIKEPILQVPRAGAFVKKLLEDHLLVSNGADCAAFYAQDGIIKAQDLDVLGLLGIEPTGVCAFVKSNGLSAWEYINFQTPHSGVQSSRPQRYEC